MSSKIFFLDKTSKMCYSVLETPMNLFDACVWAADIILLLRLTWQGEALLRMDKERLELERIKHTRETERYEERKKWRQDKQRLKLLKQKGLEPEPSGSGNVTDGPLPCTTPSLPSNTEFVPSVESIPKTEG
jgi:hypothetical protein